VYFASENTVVRTSNYTYSLKTVNERLQYITVDVTNYLHQASIRYLPLHPSCGSSEMNYGSWLSKNWISHQPISKWIHADLPAYGKKEFNRSELGKEYCLYKLPQIRCWCGTRGIPFPAELKTIGPSRTWFLNIVTDFIHLFTHYTDDKISTYLKDQITIVEYTTVQNQTPIDRKDWFDKYVETGKKHPPEVTPSFDVNSVRKDIQDLISLHLCIVSGVMHGCSGNFVGRHVKLYLAIFHRVDKAL
jgi:hypothetical protein